MLIKFTPDHETATNALYDYLKKRLSSGKSVLWLLSGGSNINVEVNILQRLPKDLLQNLQTSLIDERYGPIGHADSNAQQLIEAGFDTAAAPFTPVLQPGMDMPATAQAFEQFMSHAFETVDIVIGQLGIGDDGHIAGIKPHSPAIETTGLVSAYGWEDYQRITLTFEALRRLTASFTLVWGSSKLAMLQTLQDEDQPLADQPAQILKVMPDAVLYTDQS